MHFALSRPKLSGVAMSCWVAARSGNPNDVGMLWSIPLISSCDDLVLCEIENGVSYKRLALVLSDWGPGGPRFSIANANRSLL